MCNQNLCLKLDNFYGKYVEFSFEYFGTKKVGGNDKYETTFSKSLNFNTSIKNVVLYIDVLKERLKKGSRNQNLSKTTFHRNFPRATWNFSLIPIEDINGFNHLKTPLKKSQLCYFIRCECIICNICLITNN